MLSKKALAGKQSREQIFFIFSLLLLGGVDGCFGQKRLKGGFVSQDDKISCLELSLSIVRRSGGDSNQSISNPPLADACTD